MGNGSIGQEARRRLEDLAGELKAAFGDDLLSVVLYGSAAREDHVTGASDLNVAVVLKDISLPRLEAGTAASRRWAAQGNRPLLFLSPEWIARSCDVFPLEFLDIVASHVVVAGADPFADLKVSRDNLRLQCESELKVKLIHLRTAYMELHEDLTGLARVLAASYAPIIAIGRGVLRAAGQLAPARSEDVVRDAARLTGLDPEPFAEVAAIRKGGPAAAAVAIKPLFRRYYAQVETLARAVDAGFDKGGNR